MLPEVSDQQENKKACMNKALFTSKTNEWATPRDFFEELNREFSFTLDPCSTDENAKCKKHFTEQDDGLTQNWGGGDCILQSSLWSATEKMGA